MNIQIPNGRGQENENNRRNDLEKKGSKDQQPLAHNPHPRVEPAGKKLPEGTTKALRPELRLTEKTSKIGRQANPSPVGDDIIRGVQRGPGVDSPPASEDAKMKDDPKLKGKQERGKRLGNKNSDGGSTTTNETRNGDDIKVDRAGGSECGSKNDGNDFRGHEASRINENYVFGPESTAILNAKYSHLVGRHNKYNLSGTVKHPHAHAAFGRKHFDRAIVCGMGANSRFLDVGGHVPRTATSTRKWVDKQELWKESVHSMIPIMDANDVLRNKNWRNMMKARNLLENGDTILNNACRGKATRDGLGCTCEYEEEGVKYEWRRHADLKSVDSAYYDDVMQGIENNLLEFSPNDRTAYFAFHDYAAAYRAGLRSYQTPDKEAVVAFSEEHGDVFVTSTVHGNPFPYRHRVINTLGDSWCRQLETMSGRGIAHYEVVDRLAMGSHDYLLVRMNVLPDITEFPGVPTLEEYFLKGEGEAVNLDVLEENPQSFRSCIVNGVVRTTTISRSLLVKLQPAMSEFLTFLQKYMQKEGILGEITPLSDGKLRVKVRIPQSSLIRTTTMDLTVRAEHVNICYGKTIGKHNVSQSLSNFRALVLGSDKWSIEEMNVFRDSFILAHYLASKTVVDIADYVDNSKAASRAIGASINNIRRKASDKLREAFVDSRIISIVFDMLLATLCVGLLYGFYTIVMFMTGLGVAAQTRTIIVDESSGILWPILLVFAILFFIKRRKVRANRWKRQELPSSCVRDVNRLDLAANRGVFDPKWKFKDPEWDIRGLSGASASIKLQCDKENKIEAWQIGPIFRSQSRYWTPTILHNCKKTIFAASIRATTNKLLPDPEVVKQWSVTFGEMEADFLRCMRGEGGVTVLFDEWLSRYDQTYQAKIRKDLNEVDVQEKPYFYQSFPKKELQVSEVEHHEKDTPSNTVKERQISGPTSSKKIAANPFVYALEGVAHRHLKGYCGRKNWEDICSGIQCKSEAIPNIIYGFADGSGFDMTQTATLQTRFNDMIDRILDSGLVFFDLEGSAALVKRAFKESLTLKVTFGDSKCMNAVSYEAEGRASGDGWTTFGNTLLMISYWRHIFKMAGLTKDQYLLEVKGDDVVFGVSAKHRGQVEITIARYMATKNEKSVYGLGQITKFVKWGRLEDGDFLSAQFFPTATGYRMVRIPHRVVQTLGWSTKYNPFSKNRDSVSRELLWSKGKSLEAWGGDLPIWGAMAKRLMQLGREGTHTEYNEYSDAQRLWTKSNPSDAESYLDWLCSKYPVTPAMIADFEKKVSQLQEFEVLSHPLIEALY